MASTSHLRAAQRSAFLANPWFASLTRGQRDALLGAAEVLHLRRGEMLFRQGDPVAAAGSGFYGLAAGLLKGSTLRGDGREAILAVVKPWVAARPVAEVLRLLDGIDVPSAKVQRIDEVMADPQIRARGMVVEQQHPRLGTLRLPNLPFRFSDCDTTIHQVAPDLGEHNAEVLAAWLGHGPDRVAALQAAGAL